MNKEAHMVGSVISVLASKAEKNKIISWRLAWLNHGKK